MSAYKTRREALRLMASLPALGIMSCGRRSPVETSATPAGQTTQVDDSFARLAIEHLNGQDRRGDLLAHDALSFLASHSKQYRGTSTDNGQLLDEVLSDVDVKGAEIVLAAWEDQTELTRAAALARKLLPPLTPISPLFLVVGYDIGAATSEGAALNVAHRHFVDNTHEVLYYAIHELHHTGFLARRTFPVMTCLETPSCLERLVRYCTQLEGMAVHSAFAPRQAAGRLIDDEDYAIYLDQSVADQVTKRYREVFALCQQSAVGPVLDAMSSKERLWYRFGALVSWELEKRHGRQALIDSIEEPRLFSNQIDSLLG